MKKLFYIIICVTLFSILKVNARENVYNINMDIYLNEDGSANVTEVWQVDGDSGTEWFKQIQNLGNSEIKDFKVYRDNYPLLYRENWIVNETLENKKEYYGINKIENGIELCFGKYDYAPHTFRLTYTLTNAISNVADAQIFNWRLINNMPGINFENFKINIRGFYYFPDSLDVWGTGYQGLAFVNSGTITLSNEENPKMNDKSYVVALIKFPIGTFKTNNNHPNFNNFDQVLKAYKEGSYEFGDSKASKIIKLVLGIGLISSIIALINYFAKRNGYGFINNKKIVKKETPAFRDIPCNKDIYYGNVLMKLNNFGYKETNIFGAIILKWVKENKIAFQKAVKEGIFKSSEHYSLDLTKNPTFDNNLEQELFNLMYEASLDGILEANEFEKWARINYTKFTKVFTNIQEHKLNELKQNGFIYKRHSKQECKYYNVMNDKLYEDSKQLLGLKIFLEEFSSIDKKETMEVHLWDEYLMFAYLFGIADKVMSQLKKLYPELLEQNDIDYNTMRMVNTFSARTLSSLDKARNYSAGGGGFSSGGGGGGSFGGGISGSR